MPTATRNIVIACAIAILAVFGAETWWLLRAKAQAERALAALEQKQQERDWLGRQRPAPTPQNEAVIDADLAAATTRLNELRAALRGRSGDALSAPAPATSPDAFFELAGFVEKARAQAALAKVALRPDERFSFSAYANEGPAAAQLARVHRQALIVQRLLASLWEARPLALLAVRRESPTSDGSPVQARAGQEDHFSLDPAWSLRAPGLIDTEPVRVEFTGQTSTLRAFLMSLADSGQPVVVRSIEVDPLPPAGSGSPAGAGTVPVVRQSLSKFAVTAEFVLLNPVSSAAP